MNVVYRYMCAAAIVLTGLAPSHAATLGQPNPDCDWKGPPTVDLYLRSDFNDLGPLFCPPPDSFISAQGASLSSTNNIPTRQNTASVDGLAALVFRFYGKAPFNGISVGAYVLGSGAYSFQPTASQTSTSDTVTAGLFTQTSFGNPLIGMLPEGGGYDSFRLRGGEVTSSTGTFSTSLVGEWFPVYTVWGPLRFGDKYNIQGTPLYYVLNPELMVQYDRYDSGPNKYLLFAVNSEALRVGPQIAAQLGINEKYLPQISPQIRDFLGATTALFSYHTSWDIYTHREYSFTSISATYTFGANHNFGLTAGYSTGNSEATGNIGSQVKLGLSAKL